MWQWVGTDLEESVGSYAAVLSALAAEWHGPSPLAMIQAAGPYLSWLRTTAQQCQQLGFSTQVAAAACGSTLAAVVHPSVVGANRIQLAQLLATNGFGRNLAAIAETEAQYERKWVNNSAASLSSAISGIAASRGGVRVSHAPAADPPTAISGMSVDRAAKRSPSTSSPFITTPRRHCTSTHQSKPSDRARRASKRDR